MARLLVLLALATLAHGATLSEERIAGGKQAVITNFKYQVGIRYLGRHICAGALVHQTKVVTVARCVIGYESELTEVTVLAGTIYLNGANGGEFQNVSSIEVHPKFSGGKDYDVAVVALEGKFKTSNAAPISLLPPNISKNNLKVVISGWGSKTVEGDLSSLLLYNNLVAIPDIECVKFYPKATARETCCSNAEEIGGVACYGDDGNPVVALVNNLNYLVAISSGHALCEREGFIDVFVNIQNPEITKFIQDNLV